MRRTCRSGAAHSTFGSACSRAITAFASLKVIARAICTTVASPDIARTPFSDTPALADSAATREAPSGCTRSVALGLRSLIINWPTIGSRAGAASLTRGCAAAVDECTTAAGHSAAMIAAREARSTGFTQGLLSPSPAPSPRKLPPAQSWS